MDSCKVAVATLLRARTPREKWQGAQAAVLQKRTCLLYISNPPACPRQQTALINCDTGPDRSSCPLDLVVEAVPDLGRVPPDLLDLGLARDLAGQEPEDARAQRQRLALHVRLANRPVKVHARLQPPRLLHEADQLHKGLEERLARHGRPAGGWQEVQQVNHLVVQLDPEVLPRHGQGLVVQDPGEGDALEPAQPVPVRGELLQEGTSKHQAQDAGEGLDVPVLEISQHRLQLGHLLLGHGEVVRTHAHDAVQEEHPRGVLLVVDCGVVVAEVEVIHEGAVGVLHGEVAILHHEVQNGLVYARRGGDGAVGRLDGVRGGLGPEEAVAELGPRNEAHNHAAQRLEDGLVQVKRIVGNDHHTPGVVCGTAPDDGRLALHVVPGSCRCRGPRAVRGRPVGLHLAARQRQAATGDAALQRPLDQRQYQEGCQGCIEQRPAGG
mmetsp:Transcript_77780/g.228015  ORF Transcript_77780/g.228015 Transcript_77780/m.228015 type:complete len:438 (-) Transcript_77780:98-1411(-)